MNYFIRIRLKYPDQGLMKGIYRINIGNKFYIGSANRVAERIYRHECSINNCLLQYPMPKRSYAHYSRLAQYLHENPNITYVLAEVIQRCVTPEDMYHYENMFLTEASFNPDCINGIFYATTKVLRHADTWDIEKRGNDWYYFDPQNPEVTSIPVGAPLTKAGKVANPRKTKETVPQPQPISADQIVLIKIPNKLKR